MDKQYRKGGKVMKKQCGMYAVVSLALAMGAGFTNVFAGGEYADTVERSHGCVLDLTAPKTYAECKLGPNDPPPKLVANGWYAPMRTSPHRDWRLIEEALTAKTKDSTKDVDTTAEYYLSHKGQSAASFWFYSKLEDINDSYLLIPASLDAPQGSSEKWEIKDRDLYSLGELKAYKAVMVEWARAWKAYRGSQFNPRR